MPVLVKFFNEIDQKSDLYQGVGEKAKGIIHLVQLKFSVPNGFVIHKNAYTSFLKANGIYDVICKLAEQKFEDEEEKIDEICSTIRELIFETDLQESLESQIIDYYSKLKQNLSLSNAVAVRSSMVINDSQEKPYDLDSFLNVSNDENLFYAIKNCWASLWTHWTLTQLKETYMEHANSEVAVIVQEMINAESSGVLYTINPVTGNSDEMIIDACWGLGEGASSGKAETDNYIINKISRSIQENIVDKAIMIIPNQTTGIGTSEVIVDNEKSKMSVLNKRQIRELIKLGLDIDEKIGPKQVIEWAWYQNRPYILQIHPFKSIV